MVESSEGTCTGIDIDHETGKDRDEMSCNEDIDCPITTGPFILG